MSTQETEIVPIRVCIIKGRPMDQNFFDNDSESMDCDGGAMANSDNSILCLNVTRAQIMRFQSTAAARNMDIQEWAVDILKVAAMARPGEWSVEQG